MPVVWCTDPNSVNNKPTAFALHGIQLQGNVTEKQVNALRELVNAAAEGRLILPSDGTFMLLDSGLSIESSILANAGKETVKNDVQSTKNTYILMPVSNNKATTAAAAAATTTTSHSSNMSMNPQRAMMILLATLPANMQDASNSSGSDTSSMPQYQWELHEIAPATIVIIIIVNYLCTV